MEASRFELLAMLRIFPSAALEPSAFDHGFGILRRRSLGLWLQQWFMASFSASEQDLSAKHRRLHSAAASWRPLDSGSKTTSFQRLLSWSSVIWPKSLKLESNASKLSRLLYIAWAELLAFINLMAAGLHLITSHPFFLTGFLLLIQTKRHFHS
jgi:hypothetical protein